MRGMHPACDTLAAGLKVYPHGQLVAVLAILAGTHMRYEDKLPPALLHRQPDHPERAQAGMHDPLYGKLAQAHNAIG
jgi:hypothetical protein